MHPHRSSALGYASAASALHSRRYGACSAEAAASEAFGLSVGGCIRAWRYFRPYPVRGLSLNMYACTRRATEARPRFPLMCSLGVHFGHT